MTKLQNEIPAATTSTRLTRKGSTPLYIQLVNILKDMIESGEYSQGDVFPGEAKLEKLYNVSRITVRQALQILVNKGYIHREPGKQTIVQRSKSIVAAGHRLGHLTEELKQMGYDVYSEFFGPEWVSPPDALLRVSQFKKDSKVFLFTHLIFANKHPIAVAENYLAGVREDLSITREDLYTRNFYEILENDHGINIVNGEQMIGAELANTSIAVKLSLSVGDPILVTEIIARSVSGNALLYAAVRYNGKKFKIRQLIQR